MGFKQRLAQIKCKRVKEKGVLEVFQCKKTENKEAAPKKFIWLRLFDANLSITTSLS